MNTSFVVMFIVVSSFLLLMVVFTVTIVAHCDAEFKEGGDHLIGMFFAGLHPSGADLNDRRPA